MVADLKKEEQKECQCWINHGDGDVEEIVRCFNCQKATELHEELVQALEDAEYGLSDSIGEIVDHFAIKRATEGLESARTILKKVREFGNEKMK